MHFVQIDICSRWPGCIFNEAKKVEERAKSAISLAQQLRDYRSVAVNFFASLLPFVQITNEPRDQLAERTWCDSWRWTLDDTWGEFSASPRCGTFEALDGWKADIWLSVRSPPQLSPPPDDDEEAEKRVKTSACMQSWSIVRRSVRVVHEKFPRLELRFPRLSEVDENIICTVCICCRDQRSWEERNGFCHHANHLMFRNE